MSQSNPSSPSVAPTQQQADSEAELETAKHSKKLIRTKVMAPFKVFFEGYAESITAVNESGRFDILPGHHNFISMLVPCTLVIKAPSGDRSLRIQRGLMHVKDNRVTVFLEV